MRLGATLPARVALPLAAQLVLLTAIAVAQEPPPQRRYLRFETEHFRVVFPVGMEPFARRAAASAEWAYAALSDWFIEPPAGRIALVVTDQADFPNASATPIPGNRVVLIATPDIASRTLNYYTDWVDLTLAHELTHIFHLDRARGVWRLARALFGRVPSFFPGFYQPRWVIEGLATYYESRLTGAGRAYGSGFEAMLSSEAVAGRFHTVDAANGLAPVWPAGHTPYAYGGLYFRAIAEERGDSAIVRFARRGAARLPYTLNWASTPYFGGTLTGSWKRWGARFEAEARARADSLRRFGLTVGQPLSGPAWTVPAPRYSPDGRRLAFTYITPRDDPRTVVLDAETGTVVRRQRRNGSGGNAWARGGERLYLSQPEWADRYSLYRDLYALDPATGRERRLSVGERLAAPDAAPDGKTLVAVQTGEGSNRLELIDLETGERRPLTQYRDGVNWEHPRWSPDGTRIAAERSVRGRVLDVVVLAADGVLVWEVTRDDAADLTPAWSPDGRYLLWASDRDGTYDIYAAEVPAAVSAESPDVQGSGTGARSKVWRVTRTVAGATDPDVSPDGRWLAYAALYPDGYRVERIRYDPAAWEPAGPGRRSLRPAPGARGVAARAVGEPARPYSPFPSLWPKSWLPLIYSGSAGVGAFVGATTFGADDIRRHSYAVLAGWRTEARGVEAAAVYRYAGLGDPLLDLSLSQDWSSVTLATSGGPVAAVEREREIRLAAPFLRPRVRSALAMRPELGVEESRFVPRDPLVQLSDSTFTDLKASLLLGYSQARAFPRSVSAERGFAALLELSHRRLADDLATWRVSAEAVLRGYLSFPAFGYANHVVAARLAFGASDGHRRGPEVFGLGGIPGRAFQIVPGVPIGGGSRYPVRGFEEGDQVGDRIASVSLEYRLPLLLVGRGYGLWPVLVDRISASVFVDAGSAWFDSDNVDVLASTGAELSLDLGLGYAFVYRFRAGLARPLVETTRTWSLYLMTGVAF